MQVRQCGHLLRVKAPVGAYLQRLAPLQPEADALRPAVLDRAVELVGRHDVHQHLEAALAAVKNALQEIGRDPVAALVTVGFVHDQALAAGHALANAKDPVAKKLKGFLGPARVKPLGIEQDPALAELLVQAVSVTRRLKLHPFAVIAAEVEDETEVQRCVDQVAQREGGLARAADSGNQGQRVLVLDLEHGGSKWRSNAFRYPNGTRRLLCSPMRQSRQSARAVRIRSEEQTSELQSRL